jgi:hypothetical protein
MGDSAVEKVGRAIGIALHEASEPTKEPSFKRSNRALSGLRCVAIGVGLGALAATKGVPFVKNAAMNYMTSKALEATDQVPSPPQAGADPATSGAEASRPGGGYQSGASAPVTPSGRRAPLPTRRTR